MPKKICKKKNCMICLCRQIKKLKLHQSNIEKDITDNSHRY